MSERSRHNPGDVLLSMPSTLDSYYGYGNTYQVGDVLVAATAYPLPKDRRVFVESGSRCPSHSSG